MAGWTGCEGPAAVRLPGAQPVPADEPGRTADGRLRGGGLAGPAPSLSVLLSKLSSVIGQERPAGDRRSEIELVLPARGVHRRRTQARAADL